LKIEYKNQKMDSHIPSIHSYCDRWCERCTLTSRCRVYGQTRQARSEQQDTNSQEFWDSFADSLVRAIKIISAKADALGIDLSMSDEQGRKYQEEMEKVDEEISKKRLMPLCKQYVKQVRAFMEAWPLESIYAGYTGQQLQTLSDGYEVIMWYHFLIETKIYRALYGRLTTDAMLETEDLDSPKDSDGSAKIALISIDRSVAAWMSVYDLLPSAEDPCLSLLTLLQQIKTLTEQEFPDAYDFVRPGFDE
jgi:hypothetical protein